MKKQFKVLLLIAMICVLAFATMLVSSAALDAEQGENAWRVNTGETVNGYAETLADAIANATAGDTIYLLKDTTSEDVVIDKALTINGQGNKLVFTVTNTDIKFDLKANLTLDNIEISTTKTVATATAAGLTFTANDVVAVGAKYFYVDWKKIGDTTVNITGSKTNIDTTAQALYFYNDSPGEITVTMYLGSGENKGKIKAANDLFRATSAKAMNIAIHGGVFESAGDAIYGAKNVKSCVIDGDTSITAAKTPVVLVGLDTADTLNDASVAVIGSPTGVNKYGVADNVRLSSTYVAGDRACGLNVSGGAWKSIDIYDAHIHAPMIPLRFAPGVIGGGVITIHDGTYITDSIGNSNSHRTVIYYSPAIENITLTINGGQFSHVTKDLSELDPGSASVVDNGKKEHTTGTAVTGCYPIYASAGKDTTVNINGGSFYAGRSYGVFYLTYPSDKGKITMNITDCTAIGYRWVYSTSADTDYTVNVYGGNFMNSPGQPNCMGHVLQNASHTLNVYGGTFTVAQTGASAASGAITGSAGVTYNLYGGTFSSKSNTENSSMFYLNSADIKMTIYAPGQSYVHPINGNSTSSGVTLEKANGTPSLINCGAAATVAVQGGTTIKLTNVQPNSLADVFVGATENLTYGNTGEHRLKFVLDNTPWFFTNDDAKYDFEVKSWGNLVLSAEGFTNPLTEYVFDGTFDGSYADLLALVQEYIIYELLDNDLTGFAHNEEYADLVSADRVNLTINISTVPAVILRGADITLREADSTFAYTLFSVYADSKLSLIDCDFTAATTATSCPLVQVYEDGVTLVVEGGTYKAYGGYLFHVGTATQYEKNEETTDVKEESVYKNSLPNTNVLFKDMDVYKLNGGYAFVLYGANLAEFNNVLVSFTEDYDRDYFNSEANLYPETQAAGTNYTAIYSVTTYTKVVNSYLYMRSGSSAIATYSDKLDIINSTVVGYRWAYLYNGTTNIYGGTWYNFPGQANAAGFHIVGYGMNGGPALNIYGGNFTILRSQDPGQAGNGTEIGVVYFATAADWVQTNGVSIYGGNFKSEAHKSAALFWMAKEGANLTIYPAGTSYTNYDGQPATATVTNIVRQGSGSVVKFAQAGTVVLGNGTNVTLSEGASIYVNAEGAVLNAAGVNVTIGEGGVLPEDAEMWANTNFVLTGAADMAELIEGDNYTITDKASAIAAANAAFLRAYASNTYIKPNVNLTVALDSIVPFAVGAGAKLTLNWADLAYTGTFLTVDGGNVTIKAGNFVTNNQAPIVLVNSGTLTIDGGTFNRTAWADKQQYGLIEVVIGNLYINGGQFSVNDGTSIVWLRGTADKGSTLTEVTGGTFTCVGGGAHYSMSAIFFVGDSDIANSSHVGVLNIQGGTFTGTGFVRIYAGNYAENGTDPHETQKFVANISAGEFIGNADANVTTNDRYMFQIARAGKHEINFTKDTTATIKAGAYGFFFNANASANGGVFNILGGTFDGAMCWINSGKVATWNLDSVTFKDSQLACTGNSDRMLSFGGTDTVTITNCTFDIPLNIAFIGTNENTDITIEDSVIKASRFAKTGSAKSFTITNSLLVLHGNEDSVIEVGTTVLDKVTIVVKKTATSAAPIVGAAKFANGAHPVVFYGGNEYYAWSTNKASNENASTVSGTAIYVDTAAESTSGIRFSSTVSADVVAALTTGSKTLKFGTLVAPADYVAKAKAFTPAALDAAITSGVAYVTIPAVHSVVYGGDGSVSFSGILVNLKSNTRAYAAVSYIEVYEGETLVETIYSAYNTGDNATSAKFMADTILADEAKLAEYGGGEVAILNKYAAVAQ